MDSFVFYLTAALITLALFVSLFAADEEAMAQCQREHSLSTCQHELKQ